MANGDDALAAGFDVVHPTDDRRMGYDEINKSRDYTAQLKDVVATSPPNPHTHSAADIDRGTLSSARLPNDVSADKVTAAAYARSSSGPATWFSMWANGDFQLMRNTSSRRYKTQIRDADIEEGVAALLERKVRARTYHRRGTRRGARELGLIAEETVAVPHLTSWDQLRGKNGEVINPDSEWIPEAVRYEQVLPVYLLEIVQRLHDRIVELENR